MPSMLPFTEEDFAQAWEQSGDLLPALRSAKIEEGFNGIFSFTPDGGPLIGESADVAGFWIAEAVWVTHSAGVAKAVAQLLVDGRTEFDLHGCDVHRFEEVQRAAGVRRGDLGSRTSWRSTTWSTRCSPGLPRATSGSARSTPASEQLGAVFLEGAGLGAAALVRGQRPAAGRPARRMDPAGARPLVRAVPLADRGRRGVAHPRGRRPVRHDPAEALRGQRARRARRARPPDHREDGQEPSAPSPTPSCSTRPAASAATGPWPGSATTGSRSAPTVPSTSTTSTGTCRPTGRVQVRDLTGGTCCIGVWGPLARELVQPLSREDFSNDGPAVLPRASGRGSAASPSLRCACPTSASSAGSCTPARTSGCGCGTCCGPRVRTTG